MPKAEGTARKMMPFTVRVIVSRSRVHSPRKTSAASVGNAACETAMPKMPFGSMMSAKAVT